MHRSRLIPVTAALAGVALAASGCGEVTLDVGSAEKAISSQYEQQLDGANTVRSTNCPDGISAEIGTRATCRMVLANDVRADISLEVTGENGRFSWKAVKTVAPGSIYEQQFAERIGKQTKTAPSRVDCPAEIEIKDGTRAKCTLYAEDGSSVDATITLEGDNGQFSYEVDEKLNP